MKTNYSWHLLTEYFIRFSMMLRIIIHIFLLVKIGIVTLIGGQVENEIETEIAIGIIVETRVAAIDTAKVGMDIR